MADYLLPRLLGLAVLTPLVSFFAILLFGTRMGKRGVAGGVCATAAILFSAVLSFSAFGVWITTHPPVPVAHHGEHETGEHQTGEHGEESHGHAETAHDEAGHAEAAHAETHGDGDSASHAATPHYTGEIYLLGKFGDLRLTISYYIDALTICMFCMVTLIATCIHSYAQGYMHDELVDDYVDHEATLDDGSHVHRPGRYHRFFQYLSLFCFSMLGLVYAGNIVMVFVFWELVGICSYFLIGFYIERQSASTAANKAFIVNRVGDFGMIIGLMVIWTGLGTFSFGDVPLFDDNGVALVDEHGEQLEQPGIFTQVRTAVAHHTPDGIIKAASPDETAALVAVAGPDASRAELSQLIDEQVPQWRAEKDEKGAPRGYWLMIVGGVGIFCGCVGKSAQFPLHTWLPDAMEGPTPVSALVHSATMVAAGVYLVGRFYPFFVPEVLLVIACTGVFTLFMAATIAITATDIKRVLAYSTISQLGYMMLALGVGGWLAGMMHLITHAFFKSLLFMCSGSVIHAVHTNEMTEMGGLRKKMPYTAYTMLVGCLAIIGAGVPFLIGFSGYYSKDAILEQSLSLMQTPGNPGWTQVFFLAAAGGAAITAFYMFRLWYLTFAGEPRNQERYDHAHESPKVMYVPLVVLAVFAAGVAWHLPFPGSDSPSLANVNLTNLLEQARPLETLADAPGQLIAMTWPAEHKSHASGIVVQATMVAFATAMGGLLLATVFYCWRKLNPEDVRNQFAWVYRFLLHKWWFDELYNFLFERPVHFVASLASAIDKTIFDRLIDGTASVVKTFAKWFELVADQKIVDGAVNGFANRVYASGLWLRNVQRGNLREYVLFIMIGAAVIYMLMSFFGGGAIAG